MRSIPSNAAPAATKGTAPRYGQLRQPLPARAHPPPRRRHPSRLRLPHRHGSPPRPTGRRSTGPPFLGTARRGEPAAGGPDRRADRNARPAQHRTRTITAVPDTPGHTPRTFRTRLFLRPLRPPKAPSPGTPAARTHPGMRPLRTPQGNANKHDNRLRHPDTTRRYNLPIR